ncbi:DUF4240 domain-containing protein [Mucilaginibacter calamicampi]|uniref:DUF4240 domain-containing protein n=1 Tax=Mucilaginibacter calamicampi TaxID=1302352 RepID=A0ABW2Z228_9SPHI
MHSRLFVIALLTVLCIGCSAKEDKRSFKPVSEFTKAEKMDEKEFWKIIDYSYNAAKGNLDLQNEIIVKKLSAYAPEEIINFEIILCKKLIEANNYKILAANKIIDAYVSDDGFLYFRLWLISLGRETFEQTIKNPDYLAGVVDNGVVPDFEHLLYVSTQAYKNKTGKQQEDDSFPRDVAFNKGLNYDLGGPAITGNDWKEDELPKLYPKLWEKFN